ncbi:MAG: hypothetical protein HJJLKODD_02533 [Phycisphaerae bacterium]|nr:hypothetical protein [Phycisphaerae bacterium]
MVDKTGSPSATQRTNAYYSLLAILLLLAGAFYHYLLIRYDHSLDLSGDEAHYWEWARRPLQWSYYSKGPLVAYIIAAGRFLFGHWSQTVMGNDLLAVRLPAMVLGTLTGLGIFTLASQVLRSARRALFTVLLTMTVPILAIGSGLMTIDSPFVCLWCWALVVFYRALQSGRWWWLLGALLIALGILAKYTMVLIFVSVGLCILLQPVWRIWLKRPAPYLAVLLALVVGLGPILYWNSQHQWVSFRHVAGQAGVSTGVSVDVAGVLVYVGGQVGVANPIWFLLMWWAAWNWLRSWRNSSLPLSPRDPGKDFLFINMLIPWLVFLIFSPITKVQVNWPVVSLIPGVIILADLLSEWWSTHRQRARRFAIGGVVLGIFMVTFLHHSSWFFPVLKYLAGQPTPWDLTPMAKVDPAVRLRGWSQLGREVGEVLEAEHRAGRDPFILTDHYQVASAIAFYCPGQPTVYCAQSAMGRRKSQYDLWTNPLDQPEKFIGRPVIYIGAIRPELHQVGEPPPPLPGLWVIRQVEHRVQGQLLQTWPIAYSDHFQGFRVKSSDRQLY